MNRPKIYSLFGKLPPFLLFIISIAILSSLPATGQEKPPKPIAVTVSTLQHLNFGTLIVSGAGGTVTVDYNGTRSSTNEVYIQSLSNSEIPSPALFEVTALRGTLITIVNGPPVNLTGNHGGTISLVLGQSNTGSPFVVRGSITEVAIGGTLTIGSLGANPTGDYSGSFTVTFVQN